MIFRSYGVWEMVLNEFDPREQPGENKNEQVAGKDLNSTLHFWDSAWIVQILENYSLESILFIYLQNYSQELSF